MSEETQIIITGFSNPTNEGVIIHMNAPARLKTGTGYFQTHFVSWDKIGAAIIHNYASDPVEERNIYNKQ